MLQLNYKSGVPICDQIVNGFIRMRALGIALAGEQLPSVRQLAMELCINPNTVQKAYQTLESEGVIYSVKGKGSFFAEGETADMAVIKAAKADFRKAVEDAVSLGATDNELKEIIDEVTKGGRAND